MRITIFQNQSISKQLTTFYLVLSLEVYKVYFYPSLIFGPHVSFSECYSITFHLKIEYKEICTINTYNSNHHAVSFSFHCASNDHSLVLFFLFSPNIFMLWQNSLAVRTPDSQSTAPMFKTTGSQQSRLGLSFFQDQSNEFQELPGL